MSASDTRTGGGLRPTPFPGARPQPRVIDVTQPAYLRYPHVQGELIAFTAEDDVWLAPLDGGRAWRVSADNRPVRQPRISPDSTHVAWTSTRDGAPEVHLAPVDGGPSKRLTYWGDARTTVRGWTPEGDVLVTSTQGQVSLRRSWARAVPIDGGPARTLPYGPVGSLAYGPGGRVLLLSATMGREAATWKRYRGGTAGKLWLAQAPGEGQGPHGVPDFVRIHEGLDGNIECPMWVGDRLAFLSDHEGVGALYSSPRRLRPASAHRGRGLLRPPRDDRRRPRQLRLGR